MRFDTGASDFSPFVGFRAPVPKLQSRRFRDQPKQPKHPKSSSRPFDPDDLAARLRVVIAEREAADALSVERKRRAQKVGADGRRQSQPPALRDSAEVSKSVHMDLPEAARMEARGEDTGPSSNKTLSSQRSPVFEYSSRHRMAGRAPMLDDRDKVSPLLAGPIPHLTTTAREHGSYNPRAHEPSSATSHMAGDPVAQQTSRHASIRAVGESEPLSHSGQARRSSQRASWGLWAGGHESVPAPWDPLVRETQGRRPRTVSAGDMLEARGNEAGEPAVDVEERSYDTEAAHYEIANGRRMDWARADEEDKEKKSNKSPRKSILGFRRSSTAKSGREGEDQSSEGSVGEEREVGDAAQGRTLKSPKFSRAKSFWPFRRHAAVGTQ